MCRGERLLFLGCKSACFLQMWITLHNFTSGEVVLTTYMIVVLFLERPALLSAPRPQTSLSSCTALQLLNGNLYKEENAYSHCMLAYNADSVNSAKSRLYLGFVCSAIYLQLSHPTAAVEQLPTQVILCFYKKPLASASIL